jgi:hypothetical protein
MYFYSNVPNNKSITNPLFRRDTAMTANEITGYIAKLDRIYQAGNATEHSYRPALQQLLEDIVHTKSRPMLNSLQITNEPKRIACGAPDYIITRSEIPIGYIEAKDIGADLDGKTHKEQFDRYKQTLNNIIFTDYLDFRFYRNGDLTEKIRIGEIRNDKIVPIKENFERFDLLITQFGHAQAQSITSSDILAKIMAAKARLLAGIIEKALLEPGNDSILAEQMAAFDYILIKAISSKEFADIYAQTIAYGMFAARLRNTKSDTFTRKDIAELIPKTSPFLRNLFDSIAGINIDDRIRWVVDDLAETFKVTDIQTIMSDFGKDTQQNDPIIHFYEDFLSAYDPALRKNRGVWYTPQAVVSFIVGAVDEILQKEFTLQDGLANTSTTKIKVRELSGESSEIDVHKVQILDPATGTGTFLAETITQIYDKFKNQKGSWPDYVKQHLIPRLNGFELLMAPYTMAHIKLDWLLAQTGYSSTDNQRLRIYLTNSLDEQHPQIGAQFAQFLFREAVQAHEIKRGAPVMVVMGNPPYSGESMNKSDWIMELMNDYKKEPGANLPLQERNSKWINDDYCKFIRLGQKFVDKNKEGILAYINNHSFIDNPTFRGMRWNLMRSFDKIYIIDLHGNAKKKEVCPDGGKDENVFNIQQGVSINIFVKTGHKAKDALADVFHFDLYGKREDKYKYLRGRKLSKIPFTKLQPSAPEYFFVPKNYGDRAEYESGFNILELFPVNSIGIVTARDNFTIHNTSQAVKNTINEFIKLDIEAARDRFNLGKDTRDWSVLGAKNDLTFSPDFNKIVEINYRPFDKRFTYYTGNSKGFHCMPREKVMQHFLKGENVGLVVPKICKEKNCFFITKHIMGHKLCSAYDSNSVFPLYLYLNEAENRKPNLNETLINEISQRIGLRFTAEKEETKKTFAPIDLLDYIYAILHCPAYREKYKEFLKTDFPRIPYPEDAKQFRQLAKQGEKLRRLHLLEDIKLKDGWADFDIPGSCEIDRPYYSNGKIYINNTQYFDNVPQEAWDFYIGGYQPAQKWLKDRRGRVLDFDDVQHYRRVVWALRETGRVMRETGV